MSPAHFCLFVSWSQSRVICLFFSSRRRHTRWNCDWSSDVCSSDLRQDLKRERWPHTGSGKQHLKEMLFARGNKTVQRQRIFTHMGVDQERHFGVELAKRVVRRKRHLHEVADAAHVHEHLIRSFFAEPSAKLANHRTPVLPLSLRPSTSGLIASVCAIPRDKLGGPRNFAVDKAGQEVYMTGCLYNWGAGWMPRRSTVTALFLFTIRSSSDCSSKFARER